jgi:hypothetical protein
MNVMSALQPEGRLTFLYIHAQVLGCTDSHASTRQLNLVLGQKVQAANQRPSATDQSACNPGERSAYRKAS